MNCIVLHVDLLLSNLARFDSLEFVSCTLGLLFPAGPPPAPPVTSLIISSILNGSAASFSNCTGPFRSCVV